MFFDLGDCIHVILSCNSSSFPDQDRVTAASTESVILVNLGFTIRTPNLLRHNNWSTAGTAELAAMINNGATVSAIRYDVYLYQYISWDIMIADTHKGVTRLISLKSIVRPHLLLSDSLPAIRHTSKNSRCFP